ncbi:Alpha/Beta hydrolase protein [Aspergillus unguis]
MRTPLSSDITLNAARFHEANITPSTKTAAALLEKITKHGPKWWAVPGGAAAYRELRETGQTPLPKPVYLPEARDEVIPSREEGRDIPIRVYRPDEGGSRGVVLHFHGGGFVLGSQRHSDTTLRLYANSLNLTAISVGYRLAPEHPYPAALHDAIDAAIYIADNSPTQYGGGLRFITGESAGGCLAVQSALHLLRLKRGHITTTLRGLVLPYGWFDLSLSLPSIVNCQKEGGGLMIDLPTMQRFRDAYVPGLSSADGNDERRNPAVSPVYEDLQGLGSTENGEGLLPPALFLVGTADPLLDDTVLMSTKWASAGGESIVKIYPGATHGFTVLPGLDVADEANEVTMEFLRRRLEDQD